MLTASANEFASAAATLVVIDDSGAPSFTTASELTTEDGLFTVDWTEVPGAESYEVMVTRAESPEIDAIRQETLDLTFRPARPLAIGDYSVWVRGKNGEQASKWSAATSGSCERAGEAENTGTGFRGE